MSIHSYKIFNQSENGEDGIIELIFKKINISIGTYLEIGGLGGIHNSNTFMLFKNNWKGIYIESNRYIFKDLLINFKKHSKNITLINESIEITGNNTIDNIINLSQNLKKDIDFASINFNGLEYDIFESLNQILPKVICFKFNSLINPVYDKELNDKDDIRKNLNYWKKLCDEKDYFIIAYTGYLILVKNLYKPLFSEFIKKVEDIYQDFLESLDYYKLEELYNCYKNNENSGEIYENKLLLDYYNKIISSKKENYTEEISEEKIVINFDEEIIKIEKALLEILNSVKNLKELHQNSLK